MIRLPLLSRPFFGAIDQPLEVLDEAAWKPTALLPPSMLGQRRTFVITVWPAASPSHIEIHLSSAHGLDRQRLLATEIRTVNAFAAASQRTGHLQEAQRAVTLCPPPSFGCVTTPQPLSQLSPTLDFAQLQPSRHAKVVRAREAGQRLAYASTNRTSRSPPKRRSPLLLKVQTLVRKNADTQESHVTFTSRAQLDGLCD